MLSPTTAALVFFAASTGVQAATIIPSNSFSSVSTFQTYWNYLYPWGSDHNGSTLLFLICNDTPFIDVKVPG
jgi:hypothetical protein